MKEMFRSFRIFTGGFTIKSILQTAAAFVVVFGVVSLLSLIEVPEDSFMAGFFASFIPAFGMFIPLLGAFLLNAIYNYNNPMTQGYKYFHSMCDGEKRYVGAILAANLVALVVLIIAVALQFGVLALIGKGVSPAYSAVIAMIAIGVINLVGNTRRSWLRFFALMPIFVIAGFTFGYSAALIEDGESIPDIVMWIAMGVAVVVYVIGLVYTMATSARKWRRNE